MPACDFVGALRALAEGGVQFAVVGGLAAVLNGAPVNTFDLDIVPARDEENVAKLVGVLGAMDAANRGPLDVLGTIGRGLDYEDLLPHTVEMEIGGGVRIRVLDLAAIIALKEELAGKRIWRCCLFCGARSSRNSGRPGSGIADFEEPATGSPAESVRGTSLRLSGFLFAVLGRRLGCERTEKTGGDVGYFVDRGEERSFVGLGWLIKAANLSHEL